MWHDALLMAQKDLRLELRSRVAINQVVPFSVLMLVLFAFALDPDRGGLRQATAGLFWVAVLFSTILAVQRSFAVEAADGNRDGLRMSALAPGGIFLGKAAGIVVQLVALEVILAIGATILYAPHWHSPLVLVGTAVLATVGLAAAGTLYGALAAGLRVKETLLPLLLLPVVAPVLIAATQAFEAALNQTVSDAWQWLGLLSVFAIVYVAFGILGFGSLLEES